MQVARYLYRVTLRPGGIGSSGIFTHGAQVQPRTAAGKEQADCDCQYHRKVDQKAVGEEKLTDGAHILGKGEGGLVCLGYLNKSKVGNVAFDDFDEGAAEEITDTHAEGGNGKTGDILICLEGDGEEAVKQRRKQRTDKAAQQRNEHGGYRLYTGGGILVEEAADPRRRWRRYT